MRPQLSSYIDALRPIIHINHFCHEEVLSELQKISPKATLLEYTNSGLNINGVPTNLPNNKLEDFLGTISTGYYPNQSFLCLVDMHEQLSSPRVLSLLKKIAYRHMHDDEFYITIFILSVHSFIPQEIEHLVTTCSIPLPTQNEIEEFIKSYAKGLHFPISEQDTGKLALSLKGLSFFQIQQILNHSYCYGGKVSGDDLTLILEDKKQIVLKSNLLEMIDNNNSLEDIGGLIKLKKWLLRKKKIFQNLDQALKAGVSMPHGILILGLPGCGKSLTAKATARAFEVPLIRLDVGRLLGKYVGESETNMRKAFSLAEAVSPCVLWIDEIEKAFAGGTDGGHEVTRRLLGLFLTWMQEKQSTVFCVATSNNIDSLPPEFMRKGRFDEIFSVELPTEKERYDILKVLLKRRGQFSNDITLYPLVKLTNGFSGADLEAGINEAIETIFLEKRPKLTNSDLKDGLARITPIETSMRPKIETMREHIKQYDICQAS